MGFVQEYKSARELEALAEFLAPNAVVVRDGQRLPVDAREIVPGDIVVLETGEVVPADLRILEANGLSADQSALTGESAPAYKSARIIASAANLKKQGKLSPQELSNAVFMGSTIAGGSGLGVVVATGAATEFGQVAKLVSQEYESDFQKSVRKFGDLLLRVTLVLTVFVFAVNALLGRGLFESLLFALALAVGITPEVLPTIITLNLTQGARRLAHKKVVVRKLEAIEDLGNIDVLCTDKTGTLTENALSLWQAFDAQGKPTNELIEIGLLCNSLSQSEAQKGKAQGIDAALWRHATQEGFDQIRLSEWKKEAEIPFDFETRRYAAVVQRQGERLLIVKGAPESVLPLAGRKDLLAKAAGWEEKGLRVIAVAQKKIAAKESYGPQDEKELELVGFFAFQDPPKKGVQAAIESFEKMGVRLVLLTGDSPKVAQAICREVRLPITGKVVIGSDLEQMSDGQLSKLLDNTSVFARVTPQQKLRIVRALVSKGLVVGFVGDGANDAPALKAADVGISVREAVGVAREAADLVLLHKGLGVIADGIEEGRRTFQNTTKYINYTISANFGNIITIAAASLFLPFIPLLPTQVLLINLLTDLPTLAISADRVDKDALKRPRHWNFSFITKFMVFFGLISTAFDLLTIFLLSSVLKAGVDSFRSAWFFESVASELVILYSLRTHKPFWKAMPSPLMLCASVLSLAATALLASYQPAAELLKLTPIPLATLGAVALVVAGYFASTEIAKHSFYSKVIE